MEQAPDADVVLVPVSSSGLIAGVATAVKALRARGLNEEADTLAACEPVTDKATAAAAYAAAAAAAYAAAYAAAATADARARTLAKCADIVRKHYPTAPRLA